MHPTCPSTSQIAGTCRCLSGAVWIFGRVLIVVVGGRPDPTVPLHNVAFKPGTCSTSNNFRFGQRQKHESGPHDIQLNLRINRKTVYVKRCLSHDSTPRPVSIIKNESECSMLRTVGRSRHEFKNTQRVSHPRIIETRRSGCRIP